VTACLAVKIFLSHEKTLTLDRRRSAPVSRKMRLMENVLEFDLLERDGSTSRKSVNVKRLFLGRNTSRDIAGTKKNLDSLRGDGYSVHGNPNTCRKSRYLLTNEEVIEVQGPQTSGEVEYVAIFEGGEVFVSVGSDHNDRTLQYISNESLGKVFDSAKTKQMCPAVVARTAWRYSDVKDHWDDLNLKSFITVYGSKLPYQDFKLSNLVDLEYHLRNNSSLRDDGTVLFGGSSEMLSNVPSTIYTGQSMIKGVTFPTDFNMELGDPVIGRKISHSYSISVLEEIGSLSL